MGFNSYNITKGARLWLQGIFCKTDETQKKDKVPGIIFIQEVFGVTSFFLQPLVEEYAKMGFLSLAPEMFWRLKEKTELVAEDKEQFDEAMRLKGLFDFAQGIKDIEDSINYLRTHPNCNGSVAGGILSWRTFGFLVCKRYIH